jgi:putative sterol carrier protein
MALFASEEWVGALKNEINSNKEMARAGKGFDATIQFVVTGAGKRGDLSFWAHIKDGKALELVSGRKKCDYTISGDYAAWKDVVEGGQDPMQAVMIKKLVFEGNMQTIMKYIKAVDLMMESVKKVPSDF